MGSAPRGAMREGLEPEEVNSMRGMHGVLRFVLPFVSILAIGGGIGTALGQNLGGGGSGGSRGTGTLGGGGGGGAGGAGGPRGAGGAPPGGGGGGAAATGARRGRPPPAPPPRERGHQR